MCELSAPPSGIPLPEVRSSLFQDCRQQIDRHKWIESEKAGRDLGEHAIRCWVRKHWNGYLRERWLEHLEGVHYWTELDHGDFGLLQRQFQGSPYIGEITRQLKARGENLSIILWALENAIPMEEVLEILTALDINSRRIECRVENGLLSYN